MKRVVAAQHGLQVLGLASRSNSALLTDAFSSRRCACGAAKRER
jgi:hypothetical protein